MATNIVRVVKWLPEGKFEKLSLSVIKDSLPDLHITVKQLGDTILLSSMDLVCRVSLTNGAIEYIW